MPLNRLRCRSTGGVFVTRLVPGSSGTWWEQVQLPRAAREDRLDVFFAPAYTAPLSLSAPTVVTIHDVSFAAHPEWYRAREGMRLRWLSRRAAANARAIVTISEFSRREIVEHLSVRDERVRVIPPGHTGTAHHGRRHARASPAVCRVDLQPPPRPRSDPRVRRDRARASGGVARSRRRQPQLTRMKTWPPRSPASSSAAGSAGIGMCRTSSLRSCTRARARLRFLSEYEGLGLTPLEALAAGAPPVLLDTPVARESCGEAALYVEQGNLGPITQALERLLFDGADAGGAI